MVAVDDVAAVQRATRGVRSGAVHSRTPMVRRAVHTPITYVGITTYQALLTYA